MVNNTDDEWRYWIALRLVRGVGNVIGLNLVKTFRGPREVMEAGTQQLECSGLRRALARAIARFDDWAAVDEQIRRLDHVAGRLVTWHDESYPELLRHIHDPPLFLFVRGSLDDICGETAHTIAIVGSRKPTSYGRRMARVLAAGLVENGVTVISGMARGIDGEAHAAALRAGGKTIAVLGCGIDVVYPSEHHHLMLRTAKSGALVSEFPMGSQPEAENFPGRNRIISGMSLGTVVVEAAERSGSLITARFAVEHNREVFAVPGAVGLNSQGPHRLIRQGAALAESANDVLREIAPQLREKKRLRPVALAGDEAKVFSCIGDSATTLDDLVRDSGIGSAAALEALLGLELKGLVRQVPGKCYVLGDNARPRAESE